MKTFDQLKEELYEASYQIQQASSYMQEQLETNVLLADIKDELVIVEKQVEVAKRIIGEIENIEAEELNTNTDMN